MTNELLESLPSWERGLKSAGICVMVGPYRVAPLVGAWIEILLHPPVLSRSGMSLPSWERGLKSAIKVQRPDPEFGRSPRGSVD